MRIFEQDATECRTPSLVSQCAEYLREQSSLNGCPRSVQVSSGPETLKNLVELGGLQVGKAVLESVSLPPRAGTLAILLHRGAGLIAWGRHLVVRGGNSHHPVLMQKSRCMLPVMARRKTFNRA
jgi:hypothetical protein